MTLPPGPSHSHVSQTSRWIRTPTEWLRECSAKHGDVFTMRLVGIGPMVFVSSPAIVKAIFAADPDVLRAGESNTVLRPLLGTSSVLILDGAQHRRQRRLLLPPFHGERMRAYTEAMRAATLRSIASWPRNEPFALHPRMAAITLDVILKAVFGIDGASPDGARLARLLNTLLESIVSPALLVPGLLGVDAFKTFGFLPMAKAKRDADAAIFGEIRKRRAAGGEGTDILSMLLQAKDEDGAGMTDEELRDELMTLLVAGHETTATSLAWTFDALFNEYAPREKLIAEVSGTEDLAHAPYLDATVKETLRLRPVLPIVMRKVKAPVDLAGLKLPEGPRVAPCIWLVHRRGDLYRDPDRFFPDRWIGRTPDPAEWLPFGGGNRRCLGAAFAVHEMKIVLATVLRHARLEPAGPPETVRRRSITFSPRHGALAVLRERSLPN